MNDVSHVETILIADDNPDNLRVLSEILKERGYRLHIARDGNQVLKSVEVFPPDLVLLDIRMPEIDGFEVCQRLKADPRLENIPVIFISAMTETQNKIQAFGCGGVDFITKPFQPEEVLARVENHLVLRSLRSKLEELVEERTAELTQTAQELQRQVAERQRLTAILDNTSDLVSTSDINSQITYLNLAGRKLLGLSEDQNVKGMKIADFHPRWAYDIIKNEGIPAAIQNGVWASETAIFGSKGQEIPVSQVIMAHKSPEGELEFLSTIMRDIRLTKQTEKALEQEKNMVQMYLDIAGVMFLVLDAMGNITLLNKKGCEILGCEQEKVIGQNWFDNFLPQRMRDSVRKVFDQLIVGEIEPTEYYENSVLTKDGQEKIVAWHNTIIKDDQGNIVGALSSGEDITERRQVEAQLAQSDRLATMGMLAAGVAHEINNPLHFMFFNLDNAMFNLHALLTDDSNRNTRELEDNILESLKSVLEGTNRIKDISRGLSAFSRVEEDRLYLVSLTNTIETAINIAYNEIKYRAHLVKYFDQTPDIMVNEGRLSQVFINLLVNAAHAIDDGDVENNQISVRTWLEGEHVFAEVSDTGKGIAPENLDSIFEPFFTTKAVGLGSGLGLYISKNIVESYGGSIEVSSELGKGTAFIIRLPLPTEEVAVEVSQSCIPVDSNVRGRILIVDDDRLARKAMVQMLEKHHTVEADSGAEAKRILEVDSAFDLILCDVMMPDVSGADIHEWLLEKNPVLANQVLFISGGAFTPRTKDYLSNIDNIRLEKPLEATKLQRTVTELIKNIER
jgi:PAS domain S-box-containing protein